MNKEIQDLLDFIYLKKNIILRVEIKGLLGVIKFDSEIIFTTAGFQSQQTVLAFLGGIAYSICAFTIPISIN